MWVFRKVIEKPPLFNVGNLNTLVTSHSNLELFVTYCTLPVKFIPARSLEEVIVSPNTGPSAGTKLITPAGTPASLNILNTV